MDKRFWALLVAIAVAPASADAFSFGTFAPGDTIASIELSAGGSSGVVFDTGADPSDLSDDSLTYDASVSTITMTSGTVFDGDDIPLGTVLFSSAVMPIAGTEFFGGTIIGADFENGIVADFSITDIGPGGAGLLMEADYLGAVTMTASKFFAPFPVTGSLSGEFEVTGGDSDFTTAFGPEGDFFATLAGFLAGGVAPSSLCDDLTNGVGAGPACLGATDFASFTTNPTTTIVPIAVPEPRILLLLGAVAAAVGATRRR